MSSLAVSARSRRAIWPATIASAALVAQLIAGKATRDALFLTHFGLKLLPAAMIAAAAISALSVIVMSRFLTRAGPARVVPATFALSAVLFLCEFALSFKSEHATSIAVYAHTAIFSSAIGSAFWSLVNERFDPHEAKRLVGRIASGGTVGGVIGGLLVWRASAHLSVAMMLMLLAIMSIVGLWGSFGMSPKSTASTTTPAKSPKAAAAAATSSAIVTGGGFGVLGETPYLRDLAVLVGVGAISQALLDWLLSAQATEVYGHGPRLLGFFAFFNMIVGVLSFAAQMLLTRVVLEKHGLGGTIKIQPISVAAAVVVALLFPTFIVVLVLRLVEGVTRGSLYRSAYELFYTPLPNIKKRATKTLIDVGVDRVGTAIGSGVLFAVALLPSITLQTRAVLVAILGMSGIAVYVARRLQDGYVDALASSLKTGGLLLEDDDTEDLTTKKTLAETTALLDRDKLLARIEQFQKQKEAAKAAGLQSGAVAAFVSKSPTFNPAMSVVPSISTGEMTAFIDPTDGVVARAAALRSNEPHAIKGALVGGALTPALAPFVIPLLANDAVVRDVVRALRKIAPRVTGMLLDHLLDTEIDPRVRRRIPRVLKVCKTQRAASGLVLALRDPIFEVRIQVAIALGQLVGESGMKVEREAIFDTVLHELTKGRGSWSSTNAEELAAAAAAAAEPSSSRTSNADAPPASEAEAASRTGDNDELRRGLAHVFGLLGLVLDREPLSIAHRALRADDRSLRGTAFEYLEVTLPSQIRDAIVPLFGDLVARDSAQSQQKRGEQRGSKELAAELLRSRV